MRAMLALLLGVIPAAQADTGAGLCAQLEAQPGAPYLVRQAEGNWQMLARRPLAEPARAAVASAKGSLAAHIAGSRDVPVSWSGATWQGPFRCSGFSALLLSVPAASVQIGAQPAEHEMNNQPSEN
jgi:hypothetical protein